MLFSVRERRPLSSSQRKHRGHFMHRCPRSSSFLFFITSMTFAAVKKLIDSKERKIHNDFIIYLISFNIKHSTARLTTTTKQTCLKYARLNINFNPCSSTTFCLQLNAKLLGIQCLAAFAKRSRSKGVKERNLKSKSGWH